MRMLIVFMLSLAGVAAAFALSPELRQRAGQVLLQEERDKKTAQPPPTGQKVAEDGPVTLMLAQMEHKAAEAATELRQSLLPPPPQAPQEGAESAQATEPAAEPADAGEPPTSEDTAVQSATEDPGQPAKGESTPPPAPAANASAAVQQPPAPAGAGTAQSVTLPPFLSQVKFGMPPASVASAYATAWTKQTQDGVVLAHYPVADKSQMVQFQFQGDSLYLIRILLKAPDAQALKELYDRHQQTLAEQYRNVKEALRTRWSDGTVNVSIGMNKDLGAVEITFTAPSFKH